MSDSSASAQVPNDETAPVPEAAAAGEAERRKITGRAAIVALGTLASRVLGLGRDLVLAAVFSRAATDAFMVAFQIPNLLRQLVAEGAVQNAVLPVLTQTREQDGEAAARSYFRAIRGLSMLVLTVLCIAGIVFAPQLVELFAAGFRDEPGQFERTVELTRWVFPYIFFMGTAALGIAALNTYRRFVVTSFAPALLNVAFIAFALLLPGWLGARGEERILAMAAGALVGGFLQVIAQWPSLKAIGYLERPSLDFRHPGIRETLRRMAPTLLGIGVYYVDVVIGRRLLSELGQGPISYFGFALRLADFPQGIFVMALQAATLPSLATLVAKRHFGEVAETLTYSLRLALFVGLAASVLFVVLAEPIVVLLFQRGEFGPEAAEQTGLALMGQALGIWLVAGVRQLVSAFFALGDTRTPVLVAMADLCVFVASAYLLRELYGHVGVSLAVSAASLAQFALLWIFLKKRLPDLDGAYVAKSAMRTLLAAGAAGVVAYGLARNVTPPEGAGGFARAMPAVVGSGAFAVVFFAAAWLLRSPELQVIVGPVLRRLRR